MSTIPGAENTSLRCQFTPSWSCFLLLKTVHHLQVNWDVELLRSFFEVKNEHRD